MTTMVRACVEHGLVVHVDAAFLMTCPRGHGIGEDGFETLPLTEVWRRVELSLRRCSGCSKWKAPDAFSTRTDEGMRRLRSRCRRCRSVQESARDAAKRQNPGFVDAHRAKRRVRYVTQAAKEREYQRLYRAAHRARRAA